MKEIKKDNLQQNNNQNIVLEQLMEARSHIAKAAAHIKKITECTTLNKNYEEIGNFCFDLTISLIHSMNKSTYLVDNFMYDEENLDEKR